MNLLQKIHPAFLLIPVVMYVGLYLYATKDTRRLKKVENEQRKERCLEGSQGSRKVQFAYEHGYNAFGELNCIDKLGVPEGVENFAQLKSHIRVEEIKRQQRKAKQRQEKEQAKKRPKNQDSKTSKQKTLARARQNFRTQIQATSTANEPLPLPPINLFNTVLYQSVSLTLPAFVTPNPNDSKKHPAIIWITGGESNTLGEFWQQGSADNDQSASPYRQAGMIMMYPSLRGGNHNMGKIEYNYGEVDDVMAAAEYLATLPYVDRHQIYLGGHSTGGTLALLTSEIASQTNPTLFKAVISFGATPYTLAELPKGKEERLRAPSQWLNDIRIPTWIIEGAEQPSNVDSLQPMCTNNTNPKVHCVFIKGRNHFNILTPINQQISAQIVTGKPIKVSEDEF